MNYKQKYLKYKLKYLTAKKLYGGMNRTPIPPSKQPNIMRSLIRTLKNQKRNLI